MAEKIPYTESPEAALVREIEDLIRQLAVSKQPQPKVLQRLQELQKRRVEMMLPKAANKKHVYA